MYITGNTLGQNGQITRHLAMKLLSAKPRSNYFTFECEKIPSGSLSPNLTEHFIKFGIKTSIRSSSEIVCLALDGFCTWFCIFFLHCVLVFVVWHVVLFRTFVQFGMKWTIWWIYGLVKTWKRPYFYIFHGSSSSIYLNYILLLVEHFYYLDFFFIQLLQTIICIVTSV